MILSKIKTKTKSHHSLHDEYKMFIDFCVNNSQLSLNELQEKYSRISNDSKKFYYKIFEHAGKIYCNMFYRNDPEMPIICCACLTDKIFYHTWFIFKEHNSLYKKYRKQLLEIIKFLRNISKSAYESWKLKYVMKYRLIKWNMLEILENK